MTSTIPHYRAVIPNLQDSQTVSENADFGTNYTTDAPKVITKDGRSL